MAPRPRVLSLCAGVGGIDFGLRLAVDARTVCYVEREAFAASALVARMEAADLDHAPIWDDLATFDARAWRGAVDIVAGGYPCQPFSCAGKRRGADDERHLWPHVLRILVDSGAPLLFCENVAGHLSLGFADVLADLAACGFDAEWDLFRASDVGAPHRRERLFFVAYRGDDGRRVLRAALDGDGRLASGDEPHERRALVADAVPTVERRTDGARAGVTREPRDPGEVLADARCERDQFEREPRELRSSTPGAQGEGDERQRSRDAARDCGAAVGDASSDGRGEGRTEPVIRRGRHSVARDGDLVGDALGARLESGDGGGAPRTRADAWPPSATDAEGWRSWIAAGGPEPVVRRGAHGVPSTVDIDRMIAYVRAHGSTNQVAQLQADASGNPPRPMRVVRVYLECAEASCRPQKVVAREDALPSVPHENGSRARSVGQGPKEEAPMRGLREVVHADALEKEQDVQPGLPVGIGQAKRFQALADRLDRLRALGNAVVPNVAAVAFLVLARRALGGWDVMP